MQMDLELSKDEAVEAVASYLKDKGYEVDPENIRFRVQKTGQRSGISSHSVTKVEAKNVTQVDS